MSNGQTGQKREIELEQGRQFWARLGDCETKMSVLGEIWGLGQDGGILGQDGRKNFNFGVLGALFRAFRKNCWRVCCVRIAGSCFGILFFAVQICGG